MTGSELKVLLEEEVKGLTSYLDSTDYTNCLNDAQRDTGWTMPVTTDFKIKWMKERCKRHLFFYLYTESAHKFKFEQINLQHRFDHYDKILTRLDKAFEKAIEENPHEFAGMDAFHMFGTKIEAGFSYDPVTGKDKTYDSTNRVIFAPTEND